MTDTLIHLLRTRASEQPQDVIYTFLRDGEQDEQSWTYSQLDERARAIAGALQGTVAAGGRVVLLYPPGLDYVAAFFGCLYAGAVAVPAYPPDPARLSRTLPRLRAIVRDARASVVCTTSPVLAVARAIFAQAPELGDLRWLATDEIVGQGAEDGADGGTGEYRDAGAWRPPEVSGPDIAFIQYTSGSTGDPRGVCLSHQNLLHNLGLIRGGFGLGRDSVGVIWLPPYHDMGLIGGILQPLYVGFPVVLMSPLAFLARPMRWLRAVSRHRATVSGGPNFAFDLCVRKCVAEERDELDLSHWRVAFCGAEPIRSDTLQNFVETFKTAGFSPKSFYPCYGLAEATLIVSGGQRDALPVVETFDARALQESRAESAPGASSGAEPGGETILVGCGQALGGQEIAIVKAETGATGIRCADGEVGEIWLRGPSVAQGYFGRPEDTALIFAGNLAEDDPGEPYLRTGDLGFLHQGELYVTGRSKDLIIVRGRNHYPQDIEHTVSTSHSIMRPGCCTAFAIDSGGHERVAVVQEVDPRRGSLAEGLDAAVRAVADQHEIPLHGLYLVARGAVPKTSSGKVQRRACRAALLAGTLDVLAASTPGAEKPDTGGSGTDRDAGDGDIAVPGATEAELAHWLTGAIAEIFAVDAGAIALDQSIAHHGLDSLRAVTLQSYLAEELGVEVALEEIVRGPTILQLARRIRPALTTRSPAGSTTALPPGPTTGSPRGQEPGPSRHGLSHGQRALWFLYRMDPQSAAANVVCAARLIGDVDLDALERSFQALVGRHPMLRARYTELDGEPVCEVAEQGSVQLVRDELTSSGSPASLADHVVRQKIADEAYRPFDLEAGPLMRVTVFVRPGGERVLLWVIHHIAVDFWSLAVLLEELGEIHGSGPSPEPARTSPHGSGYADFVAWQARRLEEREPALVAYWRERLDGAPETLGLPCDFRRPAIRSTAGATVPVHIDRETARRLRRHGAEHDVHLMATLLAAYSVLLGRHSGQSEVVVGTPTAGRRSGAFEAVVGFFVNMVPVRVVVGDGGAGTFAELARQVRRDLIAAVDHQDLPFVRLVERLHTRRDPSRSPVFQAGFALYQAGQRWNAQLPAMAMGVPGTRLTLGDLELEAMAVEQRVSQFDLSLALAERPDGGLTGWFEYSVELFERRSVEYLGQHLAEILSGLADTGFSRPVHSLPWLPAEDRARLLHEWSTTPAPPLAPGQDAIHCLFESQAAARPDAIAIEHGSARITYGELNDACNRLADFLRRRGIGPEDIVGLHMTRTPAAVMAVLAVLKAGAAYMPLWPEIPRPRLQQMIADARPAVVICDGDPVLAGGDAPVLSWNRDLEPVIGDNDARNADPGSAGPATTAGSWSVAADNLAYVLFTSGSTGAPKGVMISHGSLCNRILWGQEVQPIGPGDGVLQATALSFDVSVWEMFTALSWGGRLILPLSGQERDPGALVDLMVAREVSKVGFVPSFLSALLDDGELNRCVSLRYLFVGGEALPADLLERTLAALPRVRLYNFYGPTETTIDATFWPCVPGPERRQVAIGRPVGNARVYVLDRQLAPVAVGAVGELYVGGRGVARGYLGRPALTAERFIPDPFSVQPGARMYRTGDRVRWGPDGQLHFLGRMDRQVKVRGNRLELGDVEAALREHPAVRDAVATLHSARRPSDRELTALLDEIERLSDREAEARLARPGQLGDPGQGGQLGQLGQLGDRR